MKEIKLKPSLLYKEVVLINGKEYWWCGIDGSGTGQHIFRTDAQGRDDKYLFSHEFEIIESPDHSTDDGKPNMCAHFMKAVCVDCKLEYCNCHAPFTTRCSKCGIDPDYIERNHIADDGKKVEEKLFDWRIGDVVKFKGNPFDEQIETELQKYLDQKGKLQRITDIKPAPYNGTTGWWIKTDLNDQWIDRAWFKKVKQKSPLKLRVGGVYKRRDGKIEKIKQILYLHALSVRYESENEFLYHIDGRYYLTEESSCDLIEEVHPEDVYTVAPDENLPHVHPLIPLSELPSWEELESLRKENAELYARLRGLKAQLEGRDNTIQFLRASASKPESNPFKVEDMVLVYGYIVSRNDSTEWVLKPRKCQISQINDDGMLRIKFGPVEYSAHYKQCELVND